MQYPRRDVPRRCFPPQNVPGHLTVRRVQDRKLQNVPLLVRLVHEPRRQVKRQVVRPIKEAVVQHLILEPIGPHHHHLDHVNFRGKQPRQRHGRLHAGYPPLFIVEALIFQEPALEEPRVFVGQDPGVRQRDVRPFAQNDVVVAS